MLSLFVVIVFLFACGNSIVPREESLKQLSQRQYGSFWLKTGLEEKQFEHFQWLEMNFMAFNERGESAEERETAVEDSDATEGGRGMADGENQDRYESEERNCKKLCSTPFVAILK